MGLKMNTFMNKIFRLMILIVNLNSLFKVLQRSTNNRFPGNNKKTQ